MDNSKSNVEVNDNNRKRRIIAIIVAAIVLLAVIIGIFLYTRAITAVTMRIQRLVGTVNLMGENGKEQTIRETMRPDRNYCRREPHHGQS